MAMDQYNIVPLTMANIDWLSVAAPRSSSNPPGETRVLGPNGSLCKADGFIPSPSGAFRFGIDSSGKLLLKDRNSNPVWSAGVQGGECCYMQGDGNMVLRNSNRQSIWDTDTFGNDGAGFTLDDKGRAAIVRGGTVLWTAGVSSSPQTPAPASAPRPAAPVSADEVKTKSLAKGFGCLP
jgi:hypothetical protein